MTKNQKFPINVLETDKMGRMYIKLAGSQITEVNSYFAGVERLQSFLRSKELEFYVTGFFLSMWNNGGIRFSYFTNNPRQTISFLRNKLSSIGFVQYLNEEKPKDALFSSYLGEAKTELDFRRFLQLITNIGLDLLERNILYSRRLVGKYRLEIGPSGISSKPHFEQAFKKLDYYNSLIPDLRKELLDGLDYWHTSWEDWAHMFVVMLLPGDWLYSCRPIFNPRRPIHKNTQDALLKGSGLELPNNWQP